MPLGLDPAPGARDCPSGAPNNGRPRPRPPQGPHKAAEPVYGRRFDPWNAVSLGHQRAEAAGPLGWRDSRAAKLGSQFRAGHGGGERASDAVGAGSRDFDQRLGVVVSREVRARAATSVLDMLRGPAAKDGQLSRRRPGSVAPPRASTAAVPALPQPPSLSASAPASAPSSASAERAAPQRTTSSSTEVSDPFGYGVQSAPPSPSRTRAAPTAEEALAAQRRAEDEACEQDRLSKPRGIFDGLVVYVNGSMHPHISDHRLKHVLAENGARMTIYLGRRQVTHVILGRPASTSSASAVGAAGGLAGGKLDREILRTRGCGIKYVDVHWVLESVKAGRRLPEAGFSSLKIAPSGQQSVYGAFSRAATRPAPAAAAATKGDTRTHNGS
ncbi:hypothetical protein RB595_003029 [Gaeumannomyces hyphopodioides]